MPVSLLDQHQALGACLNLLLVFIILFSAFLILSYFLSCLLVDQKYFFFQLRNWNCLFSHPDWKNLCMMSYVQCLQMVKQQLYSPSPPPPSPSRKPGLGKLSKYCLLLRFEFWLILVPVKIMRLNLNFNCFSSFVLTWVDKVTTGTYVFVSVIAIVVSQMTQYSNQVKIISI